MGMTLGDGSSSGVYLPPGAGGVDYGLLATYVPRTGNALPVVLELDVAIPSGELAGIIAMADVALETEDEFEIAETLEEISSGSSFWNKS